jgi:hypothetical protein
MYPGAQAKIRPQAAGSLISCARAASAGSTATRFIENNARYVEYCGAECVGLYYTCINSYLTPESPAWGRCRPRYSAESRTEFAEDSSLEGTGFEPSVPLPRLSSIPSGSRRDHRRSTDVVGETESLMSLPPGKPQHLLPRSVFDRPGSDRWNLASTTFLTRDRWFESGSLLRGISKNSRVDVSARHLALSAHRSCLIS